MFIEGWHQLICSQTHDSWRTGLCLLLRLRFLGSCSAILQHQHQMLGFDTLQN